MLDKEKVIRGLEFHKKVWDNALSYRCENEFGIRCPYEECRPGCTAVLASDALALLKEQEPRVMTREEVIDLLQGAVVWYEERAESGTYLRAMISTGNGFLGDFYLGVNAHDVELKRQRFWTSRPTPEQMRDTKWEEDSDEKPV